MPDLRPPGQLFDTAPAIAAPDESFPDIRHRRHIRAPLGSPEEINLRRAVSRFHAEVLRLQALARDADDGKAYKSDPQPPKPEDRQAWQRWLAAGWQPDTHGPHSPGWPIFLDLMQATARWSHALFRYASATGDMSVLVSGKVS